MYRFAVFCIGYETSVPAVVRAGIEMACLDAAGKSLGLPVYRLLAARRATGSSSAPMSSIATAIRRPASAGEDSPNAIAARTRELCARHGFRAIKLKGGVYRPRRIQSTGADPRRFPGRPTALGSQCRGSVETSIRIGHPAAGERDRP